jgi:hypothetical protein
VDVHSQIYEWLLGRLPEPQSEGLEDLFAVDESVFDLVGPAEDELIRDYLAGKLPPEDRACFEAKWLQSSALRKKLGVGAALLAIAREQAPAAFAPPAKSRRWPRGIPFWLVPMTAVLSGLSIVVMVACFVVVQRGNSELASLSRRLVQVERWAADRAVPGSAALAFALLPENDRAGQAAQSVSLRPGEPTVVFQLALRGAPDQSQYRVSLTPVAKGVVWSGFEAAAASTVRVTVPGRLLNQGDYYFTLDSWPRDDRHETYPVRILAP